MKKVLIIEDYYAVADMEQYLCSMEGYEVAVAASGEEGLALLDEFKPDLLLLDLSLPGAMSGTDVLEKVRAEHGDIPKVLVVSALVGSDNEDELRAHGNVDVLGKPFLIKDLATRIQIMLST